MNVLRVLFLALFLLCANECFAGVKLVVDTDMASDDALALAYLLNAPDAQVIGICATGSGVCRLETALRAVHGVLESLSLEGSVRVFRGVETNGPGGVAFPREWERDIKRFWDGQDVGGKKPVSGLDELADVIAGQDGKIVFLALGPLCDLAYLLSKHPRVVEKIERVVVMGGVFDGGGNVFEAGRLLPVEWNFRADPGALETVLKSGIPLFIVPLEACSYVPLGKELFVSVFDLPSTPSAVFVKRVVRYFHHFLTAEGSFLWDPLAAVFALNHEVCGVGQTKIKVDTASNLRGHVFEDAGGYGCFVARNARQKGFERIFLHTLASGRTD